MSLRITSTSLAIILVLVINGFSTNSLALAQNEQSKIITIPVSVYLLDDQRGKLSSKSRNERMIVIFEKVNKVWEQAGISFQIKYIGRIVLPTEIMRQLVNGNHKPFLKGRNVDFQVASPSLFNIYYASSIGFLNGIAISDNLVLVTDSRDVETYRVTAHELGHLLGLRHANNDETRLMYPGTKGTVLSSQEIKTARDSAISKLSTTYHQD